VHAVYIGGELARGRMTFAFNADSTAFEGLYNAAIGDLASSLVGHAECDAGAPAFVEDVTYAIVAGNTAMRFIEETIERALSN
jgi:hypothetical protein